MADPLFFTAIGLFVLAVISPGPSVLAIMTTGMGTGRREAFALTAGIVCGSYTWGLIALFGLIGIMQQLGMALVWLKVAGGLYLLWLAHKSLRNALSKVDPQPASIGKKRGLGGYYLAGLMLHLTNPKAVFGWGSTIAIGVRPGSAFVDAVTLVLICMAIVAVSNGAMALAFSTKAAIAFYLRARRTIQGVTGAFFGLAGTALLADVVRR